MNKINIHFPAILFAQHTSAQPATDHSKTILQQELEAQQAFNAELLRICQLQKKLLDEQSAMMVEMLEGMGRNEE